VTFVGKLYKELYDARNDFLHGNPVKVSRLFPFNDRRRPLLNLVAPLIYKVLLMCYLDDLRDRRRRVAAQQLAQTDICGKMVLEEALLKVAEET
jgi:hypothetical protein